MKTLASNAIVDAQPRYIDKGGVLRSLVGGVDQRLDRPGSKWGCTFKTKPMRGDEAIQWMARLIAGQREKVSIKMPQPGITIQQVGDFFIPTVQSAMAYVVTIKSLNAAEVGRTFKEGQFITIIQAGVRYVHQVTASTVVPAGGQVTLPIQPALRIAPAINDYVETLSPRIEGYVTPGMGMDINNAKLYGFDFDVEEAK